MAVITEINQVSTSGTTGINNIFGSGGGGGTATTAPTFTVGKSSTYTGNSITITNSSSYTDPSFRLTVEQADGTEVVAADEVTVTVQGVNYVLQWSGYGAAGTHTIKLRVQEFGDFNDSVEVTDTYTLLEAKFQYWRVYSADSSGNKVGGTSNSYVHIDEWDLYEGAGQTGTVHTDVNLTSNTSSNDYETSRGWTQYNYPAWKAFDGASNTQVWTLGASAANNWVELEFKVGGASRFATTADIPAIASMRINCGSQWSNNYYILVEASTTGAFAGEEVEIYHQHITSTGGVENLG